MKAAAREQHYQDAQEKCKPKRKRNKPAHKAAAGGNPPIPPSPQRVSKKAKGDDKKEGEDAPASGSKGEGGGNEMKGEGAEVPEAETKKAKPKRPEPEKVKEAWVVKEWEGMGKGKHVG